MAALASIAAISHRVLLQVSNVLGVQHEKGPGLLGRECSSWTRPLGGQQRRVLPKPARVKQGTVLSADQPDDDNLDLPTVLRESRLTALEFSEPLSGLQLERLSVHFPGNELKTRGNTLTIIPCGPLSSVTATEVVRQLANWARTANGKYFVGGSDTAFHVDMYEKVKFPGKDEIYIGGLMEQKGLLVPAAWVLPRTHFKQVKNRDEPQIEGCQDALLVEMIPKQTDSTDAGSVS